MNLRQALESLDSTLEVDDGVHTWAPADLITELEQSDADNLGQNMSAELQAWGATVKARMDVATAEREAAAAAGPDGEPEPPPVDLAAALAAAGESPPEGIALDVGARAAPLPWHGILEAPVYKGPNFIALIEGKKMLWPPYLRFS